MRCVTFLAQLLTFACGSSSGGSSSKNSRKGSSSSKGQEGQGIIAGVRSRHGMATSAGNTRTPGMVRAPLIASSSISSTTRSLASCRVAVTVVELEVSMVPAT